MMMIMMKTTKSLEREKIIFSSLIIKCLLIRKSNWSLSITLKSILLIWEHQLHLYLNHQWWRWQRNFQLINYHPKISMIILSKLLKIKIHFQDNTTPLIVGILLIGEQAVLIWNSVTLKNYQSNTQSWQKKEANL